MADRDPYSPEWTLTWTLRRALRSWIKPRDEHRPAVIADQVVKDLRQGNWHLVAGPPSMGWEFDAAAIRRRQAQEQEFEEKLRALDDLARSMGRLMGKRSDDGG